jgi:uncharacterized protein (DUF2235 family)
MEVSNHWGPVDAHQQLPKDRIEDLFLVNQTQIVYKEDSSAPRKHHSVAVRKSDKEMPLELKDSILREWGKNGKERRKAERQYNDRVLSQSLQGVPVPETNDLVDNKMKRVKTSAKERLSKKLRLGHKF